MIDEALTKAKMMIIRIYVIFTSDDIHISGQEALGTGVISNNITNIGTHIYMMLFSTIAIMDCCSLFFIYN